MCDVMCDEDTCTSKLEGFLYDMSGLTVNRGYFIDPRAQTLLTPAITKFCKICDNGDHIKNTLRVYCKLY